MSNDAADPQTQKVTEQPATNTVITDELVYEDEDLPELANMLGYEGPGCPVGVFANAQGEDFMTVLTSIRDSLEKHNKILYKLATAAETFSKKK